MKSLLVLGIVALVAFFSIPKTLQLEPEDHPHSPEPPLLSLTHEDPKRPETATSHSKPQLIRAFDPIELPERQKPDAAPKNRAHFERELADRGIPPRDVEGWFNHGTPATINIYSQDELHVVPGLHPNGTGSGMGKTLHISDIESATEVAEQRSALSSTHVNHESNVPKETVERLTPISEESFQTHSLRLGKRDNGKAQVLPPQNLGFSLRGPDHTFEDIRDPLKLGHLKERTVSLGHGGEILLQVSQEGWILNESGADFVIYENPFRFGPNKKYIYQEFAQVGVSETRKRQDFRWFPCAPDSGDLLGCAGVVPTDEGGDQFDLSSVGLKRARYILIRDTGKNFNNRGENTEGFDLDSLDLIHAYKERK